MLPGGYVQVRLQRAVNPQAITVPRDALIRTAQSAVVKVVNPQGVVEDVEVRADTLQGRDWIISRGLKGGERVIVENAAQHAAGSSVQAVVRQPASADAPHRWPPRRRASDGERYEWLVSSLTGRSSPG